MSAVEQLIDVDALIPDGIEPVEASRCWIFDDGKLKSLTNGEVWTPGAPLAARCRDDGATAYSWNVVRRGLSYTDAFAYASSVNVHGAFLWSHTSYQSRVSCPYPSKVLLPDGYGFEIVKEMHDSPHENCSCGIYAASTPEQLPGSGNVYGKVKLWGKVVPGEKGVRAQFAYPSEFHVHRDMADKPALKAFGVPIIVKDDLPTAGLGGLNQFMSNTGVLFPSVAVQPHRTHWLRWAIALNLAACLLNLSMVGLHVFH